MTAITRGTDTVRSLDIPKFTSRTLHCALSSGQLSWALLLLVYWLSQQPLTFMSATGAVASFVALVASLTLIAEILHYGSLKEFRAACKIAMLGNAALGVTCVMGLALVRFGSPVEAGLLAVASLQSFVVMLVQGLILNRQLAMYAVVEEQFGNYLKVKDTTF